jgi:uncharacterized surface anchored protein
MSVRSIVAWLAMLVLFVPVVASAACPVQETAVLYINGIDTTEENAERSMKTIKSEVSNAPGVNPDCVVYDYAYNTNEPLFADFLEAGLQKVDEQKISTSDFWSFFLRHASPTLALLFDATIADYYDDSNVLVDLGEFVLGDQKAEHLAKYREHLVLGRKVILVGHSQGNLYANEEWDELLPSEQGRVRIVAVATPADHVGNSGSYTTLEEDGIAKWLFPLALPANAQNEEPCDDAWICHGFKESYMRGNNSRGRIVSEIVALLPVAITGGTLEGNVRDGSFTHPLSGAVVQILDRITEKVLLETTTDASGHYRFADVAPGAYALVAFLNGNEVGYSGYVSITKGKTTTVNLPKPVPM